MFSIGELYCLDALALAMESHSRINMVMLGALVRASGFIPREAAEMLCRDTIGKKYPALVEANLAGLRLGYENVKMAQGDRNLAPLPDAPADRYVWGYANAPARRRQSADRQHRVQRSDRLARRVHSPFHPGKMYQLRTVRHGMPGYGLPVCSRYLPRKKLHGQPGADYYHCKGARCVEVCPTNALVAALEKDYPEKPHFLPNQHLLPDAIRYQTVGANSWITSDSFTDEKRVDGGVV